MDCILPDYCLTKEKYKELWDNGVFVLDTNVLFNLYRYSPKLREGFINILNKISNRLWIPHQVALEYYDNKSKVINSEINKYKIISDIILKCPKDIKNEIIKRDLSRKHTATSEITEELVKKIDESFKIINKDLNDIIKKYPTRTDFEHIDEIIRKLLMGKVGKPYSVEVLEQICKEGSKRYELKLPPGYEDEKEKEGIKKYGDLILWFQIIDMANEKKKPIILICEDLKEDWWWASSGMTLGPRPELIKEFAFKTEMLFYMYSLDQFMNYANEYINTRIEKEVIEEAKEYRAEEEERKRDTETLKKISDEIETANIIFGFGPDNVAGAAAGAALELYLRNLCEKNKLPSTKGSIHQLAQVLLKSGIINENEFKKLIYLGNIRNKCAHSVEVSKDEVESLIEHVSNLAS